MGSSRRRLDCESIAIGGNRLVLRPEPREHQAERAIVHRMRPEPDRSPDHGDRLAAVPGLVEDDGEAVKRVRLVRVAGENLAVELLRLRDPASLMMLDREF